MSRTNNGAAASLVSGKAGLVFCAVTGLSVIAVSASVLSVTFEAERLRAAAGAYETRPLEVVGALFGSPPLPPAAVAPPPASYEATTATPVAPVTGPSVAKRTKPAPPAARKRAVLRVSDRRPRKGRGIRIILSLPKGATLTAPPELRLKDGKGSAYRSVMRPGVRAEEWVWASGLEVPGRWRGAAYAPCGNRTMTATLPELTVLP